MAAAAYEAQLRIRREGEEISCAQNDLNSWLSDLKKNNSRTKAPAKSKTTEPKLSVPTNPSAHNIEEERLRGNDFFSQGKYHDAIQCYTRCLSENEAISTPVIYSNRGKSISHHFNLSCRTDVTFVEHSRSNGASQAENLEQCRI